MNNPNDDIWTIRDKDGEPIGKLPQYDQNGIQIIRLACVPTRTDGKMFLHREISNSQPKRWQVPTGVLRYTSSSGQSGSPINEYELLSLATGLPENAFSRRERIVDIGTVNAIYVANLSAMTDEEIQKQHEARNLEFTCVTIREFCELCRQGLFDPQGYPVTHETLYYLGQGIGDPDIYDLPELHIAP